MFQIRGAHWCLSGVGYTSREKKGKLSWAGHRKESHTKKWGTKEEEGVPLLEFPCMGKVSPGVLGEKEMKKEVAGGGGGQALGRYPSRASLQL